MQLKSLTPCFDLRWNLVTVGSTYCNVLPYAVMCPIGAAFVLDVIKFLSGFQVEARQSPITYCSKQKVLSCQGEFYL
jgi:hypothetical protein